MAKLKDEVEESTSNSFPPANLPFIIVYSPAHVESAVPVWHIFLAGRQSNAHGLCQVNREILSSNCFPVDTCPHQ